MASVHHGVFVRYDCAKCRNPIHMQIGIKNVAEQIEGLRDGPALYCAPCWQPENAS